MRALYANLASKCVIISKRPKSAGRGQKWFPEVDWHARYKVSMFSTHEFRIIRPSRRIRYAIAGLPASKRAAINEDQPPCFRHNECHDKEQTISKSSKYANGQPKRHLVGQYADEGRK
jgi:hypothetical protein